MRLIASAYSQRLAAFPDTPTIAEAGLPGFAFVSVAWVSDPGRYAERACRAPSALCAKIVQSAEIGQKYATLGAIQRTSTPEEIPRLPRR